jgi:hypothetical protein
MTFPAWVPAQENPEVPVNEGFGILGHAAVYGLDPDTTSALTWGVLGGRWAGFAVTASTLTLTDAAVNHIVVNRSTGAISVATATTNWDNLALFARVYRLTTASSVVTVTEDHRAGFGGVFGPAVATKPQNSRSAAYTLTAADAGAHLFHPSADTTARTFTIPANASVAWPIGTEVTFVNQNAAGVLTIAITTDTMRLAGPGTTGSRTLAANGIAAALKITATEWIISGTGLT